MDTLRFKKTLTYIFEIVYEIILKEDATTMHNLFYEEMFIRVWAISNFLSKTQVPKYTVKCVIINTAYGSRSFCSIYNIAINKICPNDIFKIIFDNEKTF